MATPYDDILKRRTAPSYEGILARRQQGSVEQGRAVASEFYRSTRIGEPGIVETLGAGRVPKPVARFIDLPLNILNAPFAGAGYVAKGLTELGAAGIERVGAALGIPGARAGAVPQETPASRFVGTAAEVASGFLVPTVRGRQIARQAALRPQGTMRAVVPEAPVRPEPPTLQQAMHRTFGEDVPVQRITRTPPGVTAAPDQIVQPVITGPLNKRIGVAAEELFTKAGIQRDQSLRISDQVTDLLGEGRISLGDMDAVLARHGLDFTSFASGVFRPSVREAARTLQVWSAVSQRIRALARQSGAEGEIERLKDFARQVDEVTRLRPAWQRLGNVWRATLVTQLATAVRNAVTQVGRIGLDTVQQALDRGLQAYFRVPPTEHPAEGLNALLNIARGGRKGQVTSILKQAPREHDRLFALYASDVATAARKEGVPLRAVDRVFDAADTAVDWANTANRVQEWAVRRSVFQARLGQRLASRGQNLNEIVRTNQLDAIGPDDIKEAVDKALEMTFATSPQRGSASDLFIRMVNAVGPLAQVAIPFPRFLINSMKFFYDFSPLGILHLTSPAQRAALAAGDMKVISRTLIGTGLLGAAYEIRKDPKLAGERWYEIRLPDGRTIDARPFNPFAGYLFLADVAVRKENGTLFRLDARDILTATLSANVRAGTGLYIVDKAIDGLLALGDPQKAWRALQELGGEFSAGFLTPLRTVTDALAEFGRFPKELRETRTEPFAGPVKARIPGLAETLPEAESPTRAGPIMREAPLLRQVTGLPLSQAKNPAEQELDRLQFNRREVLASTGDPEADRLIAKHLGPLVERNIGRLVQQSRYQRLTNAQKSEVLVQALRPLRRQATLLAMREDPRRFGRLKVQRLPTRERAVLEELGVPTR